MNVNVWDARQQQHKNFCLEIMTEQVQRNAFKIFSLLFRIHIWKHNLQRPCEIEYILSLKLEYRLIR